MSAACFQGDALRSPPARYQGEGEDIRRIFFDCRGSSRMKTCLAMTEPPSTPSPRRDTGRFVTRLLLPCFSFYLYSIGLFSYHITFSHPRGNVGPSRLKYLPYIIYYNTGWTFTFSKELFLLILMNFCFFFCRAFLWYLNIYLMVQYVVLISPKTAPPLRCEGATRWHDKKRAQGEAPTWERVENKTEIYDILCIFLQNARTVTSDLCGNF